MIAIEVKDLTKRYKEIIAVDHLNLTVEKGELFSLLGVNGAGKSTTIKMLSCLVTPTDGDAFLLGSSIKENALKVKQMINVSPQETAVAPNLSVYENLFMICGIYGNKKQAAKKKTKDMISRFHMSSIAGKKAKNLSGGWQRRLSIAMSLITDPEILFLDEPTLGLDVLARRELWEMIQSLKGHITIILTTHYLEEAEQLSDHIGIMSDGRLVAAGTSLELKQKAGTNHFEEAFVSLCKKGGNIA